MKGGIWPQNGALSPILGGNQKVAPYAMRRHNRNPINLPAAGAKPAAIVIEAAGPQASSPTGSNCTVQVVGGGVISVGAVSGPPKNMLLSAHFLS